MSDRQVYTLFFILFVILGILIRVEPLVHWQDRPNDFFANKEPVLANVDGYYYLNIAKEISQNSYSAMDTKRAYPENIPRATYPSLLPVILHFSSSIFHLSLNKVGIWFPVFLGVCLLIPIFLFSKSFGTTITVTGALAFASLSPYYALRTRLGFLDTDCLNVVLPLLCTFCFMQFGLNKTYHRYMYLSFGLLFSLFFLWWWDQTKAAVIILSLSPLFIAFLFDFRPKKKEGIIFFIVSFAMIISLLLSIDVSHIIKTAKSALGLLSYISKEQSGLFPNIGLSIQEQLKFTPMNTLLLIVSNWPCLIITTSGIFFLCVQQKTKMLYLLPMTMIGSFSFLFAKRFAIFLTPLCALGFGYFFFVLSRHIQKRLLLYFFLHPLHNFSNVVQL